MLRALTIVLAVCLLARVAAATLVIDDLEVEGFALQGMNGSQDSELQELGNISMHCFNEYRRLFLRSDENSTTTAVLSPSPGEDGVIFDSIRGGSFSLDYVRLDYHDTIDLTQGGSLDHIQVYCPSVIPGGKISVRIWDNVGGTELPDLVSQFVFAPGAFDFALSDFATDVTRANLVIVYFDSENHSGRFEINDIRVMRPYSLRMVYIPEILDFHFPPLPSPPCMFVASTPDFAPLFFVEQSVLSAAADGFVPLMEGELLPAVLPEGPMTLACTWLDERPFQDTEMTMLLELNSFAFLEVGTPGLTESASCFALTIPIVNDGGSAGSIVDVTFDPVPSQPIRIVGAQVSGVQQRGNTAAIEVTFRLEQTGSIDPGEPLFTVTWIGESAPGFVPTGAPDRIGAAQPVGTLIVAPSITRAGAEIRFASPRLVPAILHVRDVSGRRVASWTIPAGSVSTQWDGRTAQGEPTPAGVYFLSLEDMFGRSTGRMTRIR